MGATSKIEWTDASWNPIRARNRATGKVGWHCTHASEGCRNCYAEGFNARLGTGQAYTAQAEKLVEVFADQRVLQDPLKWARARRIFVGSMTDLFADFVGEPMLDQVFSTMLRADHHIYQLLTKRPVRMATYLHRRMAQDPRGKAATPPAHIWVGASAEDQYTLDRRLAVLRATPAAVRFLSLEPLLGPIDRLPLEGIDLVIVGGESGRNARPMHPEWVRRIRDICAAAGVAFFFKQWGEWAPICALTEAQSERAYFPASQVNPERRRRWRVDQVVMHADGSIHRGYGPEVYAAGSGAMLTLRLGKHATGHVLDGRVHQAMPELAKSEAA
jgi:protein gp37